MKLKEERRQLVVQLDDINDTTLGSNVTESLKVEDTQSTWGIKSFSPKSDQSETLSPCKEGLPEERVKEPADICPRETTDNCVRPREQPETEVEKQLKRERKQLVIQLDDISARHQAVLKVNAQLRKELEAEISKSGRLEKDLESKVEEVKSQLCEVSRETDDFTALESVTRHLQSEVVQLENELESMKVKIVASDQRRRELNRCLAAKEAHIEELARKMFKITFDHDKQMGERSKELEELKDQLDEMSRVLTGRDLEVLRLSDQVDKLSLGQKFVKETYDGLKSLEDEARNQKTLANKEFNNLLSRIASFNKYKYSEDD